MRLSFVKVAPFPIQPRAMTNVDPIELEKFSQLAHKWWDPNSEFKPLHDINPLRLDYIDRHRRPVRQNRAGCRLRRRHPVGKHGGTGRQRHRHRPWPTSRCRSPSCTCWKAASRSNTAKLPWKNSPPSSPAHYDVVTCMEMLEHVPDPQSVIAACAKLAKPGGWVFFSTLNRNPKSYLFAIIGAEYVLQSAAARHARLRQVHQTFRTRAVLP